MKSGPTTDPVKNVLDRLESVRRFGSGWTSLCPVPAHGDRRPSLSIGRGADGKVLLHCFAGCSFEAILAAVGLEAADLFEENSKGAGWISIVAEYDYRDEKGTLLYQVVRLQPKDFRQRRPTAVGGWTWNIGNTRRVLFHLPELLRTNSSAHVFVVEGEKDVITLEALGLVATTNAGGAGKWRREYSELLKARSVVVIPDNDRPGLDHAEQVARSLQGIAAHVRVLSLPGLPAKGDVTHWLAHGNCKEQLLAIAESTPMWTPPSKPTPSSDDLPTVLVTNRQLREVTEEVKRALLTADSEPRLFERSGQLVRVRRDENRRSMIEILSESALRGEIERSTNTRTLRRDGSEAHSPPPMVVVRDLLAQPALGFPPLEAIVEAPVMRPDGSILSTPGYDAVTRLYYCPAAGLAVPEIPEHPSEGDVSRSVGLIEDLTSDFPLSGEASRANALGLLLTPILRPCIDGVVPMVVIDAPSKGTGKTLLAEVSSLVCTGKSETMGAPRREEEWQKLLTAALAEGLTFIILDNLTDQIRSPSLERTLTSGSHVDRILGATRIVRLPQRATWVATANNAEIAGDLSRRCYWIRLDSGMARPWLREGFKHPDLLAWASMHRGELLAALLTIARAWIVAGRPKGSGPRLGKFEAWSDVIGGALHCAGISGFLGNLPEMYESMDKGTSQWEGFLRAWYRRSRGNFRAVSDLIEDLNVEPDPDSDAEDLRKFLPDELIDAFAQATDPRRRTGFARKLGIALRRRKDTRYGQDGLRLEAGGVHSHRGSNLWRVVTDAEVAEVTVAKSESEIGIPT